jgi:hypothetical protein
MDHDGDQIDPLGRDAAVERAQLVGPERNELGIVRRRRIPTPAASRSIQMVLPPAKPRYGPGQIYDVRIDRPESLSGICGSSTPRPCRIYR